MDTVALAEGYLDGASAVDELSGDGDQWLVTALGELEARGEGEGPVIKPSDAGEERSLYATLGERVLTRLEIEVHDLLCGRSAAAGGDRNALGLGSDTALAGLVAVMTNGLSVAPQVAAVAAALLVRRLGRPAWEEVCEVWSEKRLAPAGHATPSARFDVGKYLDLPDDIGHPDPIEDDGSPSGPMAAPLSGYGSVTWPSDEKAPDYAYLSDLEAADEATVTYASLKELIALNSFPFDETASHVAIALRGAQLTLGHEAERVSEISIRTLRPDHRNMRCLIGFLHPADETLTFYTGSTVPCRAAVWGYANGGDPSNMMPTGRYRYHVWRHKKIAPALRLSAGNASEDQLEAGARECVLRNTNNSQLETIDVFDLSTPYDNVHCTYFLDEQSRLGASFSSWGCLTVRGHKDPSHQWEKFQGHLKSLGVGAAVDLCLLTGKDAVLAAAGTSDIRLKVLRRGSVGDAVNQVQARLGLPETGRFDAPTVDRFTGLQRKINAEAGLGRIADGIVSDSFKSLTNWDDAST